MYFKVIDKEDKENLIGLEENLINEFLDFNIEIDNEDKDKVRDYLLSEYDKELDDTLGIESEDEIDNGDKEEYSEDFYKTINQYKIERQRAALIVMDMKNDDCQQDIFANNYLKELREINKRIFPNNHLNEQPELEDINFIEDLGKIRILSIAKTLFFNIKERHMYLCQDRFPDDLVSRLKYSPMTSQEETNHPKDNDEQAKREEKRLQTEKAREKRKEEKAARKKRGAERRKRLENARYETER